MDSVVDVKEFITSEAEELVNSVFPQKTAQLDALLQSHAFKLEKLSSVREKSWESHSKVTEETTNKPSTSALVMGEPPTKLQKMCDVGEGDVADENTLLSNSPETNEITSNTEISHLMDIVRVEIITLLESCNTIRTWVMLLLPKMEDGNNFGVSVQEETMGEVKGVETESAVFLESITSYFFSRAKVASKVIKYPRIHDYARFIAEEDEKQFVNLRHTVAELRNFYSSLHDLIVKNIDKIKKPRNCNHSSMY